MSSWSHHLKPSFRRFYCLKNRHPVSGLYSFLAIPFAYPPIGNDRFRRPRFKRLEGDYNATIYGKPCPQPDSGGTDIFEAIIEIIIETISKCWVFQWKTFWSTYSRLYRWLWRLLMAKYIHTADARRNHRFASHCLDPWRRLPLWFS